VHIHGLVRDAERQKMSKMKGNVIDPLVLNEKYGTDAVRFGLLVAAAPGNDIALSEEVIARGRNFANKIWNASRLLFSKANSGAHEPSSEIDRWIGARLNAATQSANRAFEIHRYHEAADAIWTFFWDEFCDWYLEKKKSETDWGYAFAIYDKALKLLHPIMPFLTEELWHRRGYQNSIALERYPQFDAGLSDPEIEERVRLHQEVITSTRADLADHKVDRKQKLEGVLYTSKPIDVGWVAASTNVTFDVQPSPGPGFSIQIRFLENTGNGEEHKVRLRKDNEQLEKVIANSKRQLDNPDIVRKMPEKVVATLRAKLAGYEAQLSKNRAALGE
jgi:valyl-tRNA synthetase